MNYPVGTYTAVKVVAVQSGTLLTGGTATYSESGTFSCGPFDKDVPELDKMHNLSGYHGGTLHLFSGWKCTGAGKTSDFKEK